MDDDSKTEFGSGPVRDSKEPEDAEVPNECPMCCTEKLYWITTCCKAVVHVECASKTCPKCKKDAVPLNSNVDIADFSCVCCGIKVDAPNMLIQYGCCSNFAHVACAEKWRSDYNTCMYCRRRVSDANFTVTESYGNTGPGTVVLIREFEEEVLAAFQAEEDEEDEEELVEIYQENSEMEVAMGVIRVEDDDDDDSEIEDVVQGVTTVSVMQHKLYVIADSQSAPVTETNFCYKPPENNDELYITTFLDLSSGQVAEIVEAARKSCPESERKFIQMHRFSKSIHAPTVMDFKIYFYSKLAYETHKALDEFSRFYVSTNNVWRREFGTVGSKTYDEMLAYIIIRLGSRGAPAVVQWEAPVMGIDGGPSVIHTKVLNNTKITDYQGTIVFEINGPTQPTNVYVIEKSLQPALPADINDFLNCYTMYERSDRSVFCFTSRRSKIELDNNPAEFREASLSGRRAICGLRFGDMKSSPVAGHFFKHRIVLASILVFNEEAFTTASGREFDVGSIFMKALIFGATMRHLQSPHQVFHKLLELRRTGVLMCNGLQYDTLEQQISTFVIEPNEVLQTKRIEREMPMLRTLIRGTKMESEMMVPPRLQRAKRMKTTEPEKPESESGSSSGSGSGSGSSSAIAAAVGSSSGSGSLGFSGGWIQRSKE